MGEAAAKAGAASRDAAPHTRNLNDQMKELTRNAEETGRGLAQMVLASRGGVASFAELALGLREATQGLSGVNQGMATLAPNARMAVIGLAGIVTGIAAVGAAVVAYGISVFKFSQEMYQLSQTAHGLGLTFAQLKNLTEQNEKYGISTETVISNVGRLQEALTDLSENNSQVRQQLLSRGLDPNWLNQYAVETDIIKQQNMARQKGLDIRATQLAQGKTWMQAQGEANRALRALGQNPAIMDQDAAEPLTDDQKRRLEQLERESREIGKIWGDIKKTINDISLDALTAGMPAITEFLRDVKTHSKEITDALTTEVNNIISLLREAAHLYNLITHPIDTLKQDFKEGLKTAHPAIGRLFGQESTPENEKYWADQRAQGHYTLLDGAQYYRNFAPHGGKLGSQEKTEQRNNYSNIPMLSPMSYHPGSDNGSNVIPLFQHASFTTEELTGETTKNTTQTEKLTQQLEKLNAFFDGWREKRSPTGQPTATNASFEPGGGVQLRDQALQHRAAGGPVRGGMPYLIGERGPEIMVPDASGVVVPFGGGRAGGIPGLPGYPGLQHRAAGGPVRGGMPYLIGERGPEIMAPDASGAVVPFGGGGRAGGGHNGNANPLFQRVVFVIEELVDETTRNTTQTEKLTQQIERLNEFFDRWREKRASAGGDPTGTGLGAGPNAAGSAGIPGGFAGGGGSAGGAGASGSWGANGNGNGARGSGSPTDGGSGVPNVGNPQGAGVGGGSQGGSGGIAAPAGTPIARKGLATVTTKDGKKFQVDERFAANFQGFINDYEKAGGVIGPDSGTLGERGNASGHPIGAAFDLNQVGRGKRSRRGVTLDPKVEDALASKWGLVSGNSWRRNDQGHFGVRSVAAARQALVDQGVKAADAGNNSVTDGAHVDGMDGGGSRLANQRAAFKKELDADPQLKSTVIGAMQHEGGIQSNAEQLMNMAAMRHQTIRQALYSGQYGPVTGRNRIPNIGNISAKTRHEGEEALKKVYGGSNITDYSTDQGMAGDQNYAKYMANREHYGMHKVEGAWFSAHGEKGVQWAQQQRAADRAALNAQPDRSALSKSSEVNHRGHLHVQVDAPSGTKVKYHGKNLLKDTSIQRQTQMMPTTRGPEGGANSDSSWL